MKLNPNDSTWNQCSRKTITQLQKYNPGRQRMKWPKHNSLITTSTTQNNLLTLCFCGFCIFTVYRHTWVVKFSRSTWSNTAHALSAPPRVPRQTWRSRRCSPGGRCPNCEDYTRTSNLCEAGIGLMVLNLTGALARGKSFIFPGCCCQFSVSVSDPGSGWSCCRCLQLCSSGSLSSAWTSCWTQQLNLNWPKHIDLLLSLYYYFIHLKAKRRSGCVSTLNYL